MLAGSLLAVTLSATDSAAPLWQGGGVILNSDYSYSAAMDDRMARGRSLAPRLAGGWYGMACGGRPVELVPTGHELHDSAPTLPSGITDTDGTAAVVSLAVSAGGACNGTLARATFAFYPSTGAVLFTLAFPGGVPNAAAPPADCNAVPDPNVDVRATNIPCASAADCCALCAANNSCGAYSWIGSDGSQWANRCFLKTVAAASDRQTTHLHNSALVRAPAPAPALPEGHATAFPLFRNPSGADAGWLLWQGEFFRGVFGAGSDGRVPGSGVPIVLFNASAPGSGGGVMVSTFDEHFTSKCSVRMGSSAPGEFGCGIASDVALETLPAGYASTAMLRSGGGATAGEAGVTGVVLGWGAALRTLHNTSRAAVNADVVTTKLGYWTDNEAYYDWYHWFPDVSREGRPQDVLLALNDELEDKGLPVAYYQLDAYWYDLEIAPGYCIVNWTAVPDQFPRGLSWLSMQLRKPLMLYTDTWCADNQYRDSKGGSFAFMDGDDAHKSWFYGNTSNVVPEQAQAFFHTIMRQGAAQGMGAFEVDFLDFNFQLYSRFRSQPGAHAAWLRGLDAAAVEASVGVQYCMALPQQIVNSATLNAVTSARVSPDGGRPYTRGGWGQLLAAALGIRPFTDNTWTVGVFPKGEADLVAAVLSMGPVGLADKLNTTNSTLAAAACARDGTLLQPSRPATPLDASLDRARPLGDGGSAMATHYGPTGDARWHVVVATGTASVPVHPAELWPAPLAGSDMVWWHATGHPGAAGACHAGAPVVGCLHTFSPSSPLVANAAADAVELFHAAPVINGWVLLGEPSKVVPVSAQRFDSVVAAAATGGLELRLRGSSGEAVELLFGEAGGGESERLVSKVVTVPASGTTTVSIP